MIGHVRQPQRHGGHRGRTETFFLWYIPKLGLCAVSVFSVSLWFGGT